MNGNRSGRSFGGSRPAISFGGRHSWIMIPLYWWIIAVLVVVAVVKWAIRWRMELGLAMVAWFTVHLLAPYVGGWKMAVLAIYVYLALVACWPAGRAFLMAHLWCSVSRHRARTALGQAGVSSLEGRVPYIVRVRPTAVGTMVTAWMRAGTAVEQLGQDESVQVGILRAACWAREVRITRHPRWSHLVNLHLVRLDPLAPSVHIASTLPDLLRAATGVEQDPAPVDAVVIPAQLSPPIGEGAQR